MKTYTHFILLFIALFYSCKTPYETTSNSFSQYKVENTGSDTISALEKMLKPYRDSMDKNMNEVIGYAEGDFVKEKPSGTLGELVVDAMEWNAEREGYKTSGAIYNYGGIRINQISKGKITKGKIFELLPFENELVEIEVSGTVLKQWIKHIADAGGWPVSQKMPVRFYKETVLTNFIDTIVVENQEGNEHLKINKSTFKEDSTYKILTNDYVANGGDNCSFLIPCKKKFTGLIVRDLMIKYISSLKNISPLYRKQTIYHH